MGDHALLAPSSAGRWLVCTPSARLEEQFDDKESDAAREGTLAHEIAETIAKNGKLTKKQINEYKKNPYYSPAMVLHAENFVNYVNETIPDLTYRVGAKPRLLTERRVDLSAFIPESFGSLDRALIFGFDLHVFDFKYGKGVEVSAIENKQLMIYALGVLQEFEYAFLIDRVTIHIYQPRIEFIADPWKISVAGLKQWAQDILIPGALRAWEGEGDFVVGAHCQFCRAKARCKAFNDFNLELARDAFANNPLPIMTDDEILAIYDKREIFKSWISAIDEYVLSEALKGKKWEGYKIVEGRSKSRYVNQEELADEILIQLMETNIWKPKELINLGDMERKIGKLNYKSVVGPFLSRPPGKPTVVPVTDDRPVFNTAGIVFKDEFYD